MFLSHAAVSKVFTGVFSISSGSLSPLKMRVVNQTKWRDYMELNKNNSTPQNILVILVLHLYLVIPSRESVHTCSDLRFSLLFCKFFSWRICVVHAVCNVFFGARQFFITVSDRMCLIVLAKLKPGDGWKAEVLLLLLGICRLMS